MARGHSELGRALRGAWWGLIATVVMTVFMAMGAATGSLFTSQGAFPVLIARRVLGGAGTSLTATAFAHLGYGAIAGILFAYFTRPMTLLKGIGFATFLWVIMQILWIPSLGWGDFGQIHSHWLALYTLALHLPYGAALGWLGARDDAKHAATFDDLGRLTAPRSLA